MSPFAWVAAGVLVGLTLWLGLAVAGASREIDALRERVDALEAGASGPRRLLSVGVRAPVWRIATADGEVVSSCCSRTPPVAPARISCRPPSPRLATA
jgi:hypothetical protein